MAEQRLGRLSLLSVLEEVASNPNYNCLRAVSRDVGVVSATRLWLSSTFKLDSFTVIQNK